MHLYVACAAGHAWSSLHFAPVLQELAAARRLLYMVHQAGCSSTRSLCLARAELPFTATAGGACWVADSCVAPAAGLKQDVMLSSRAAAVHTVDAHLRTQYGGIRRYCLEAGCAPCWAC